MKAVLTKYPQYQYGHKINIFVVKSNVKSKVSDNVRPLEYYNEHNDELWFIDITHLMSWFKNEFVWITGMNHLSNNNNNELFIDHLYQC